jgi:hypothetical protein
MVPRLSQLALHVHALLDISAGSGNGRDPRAGAERNALAGRLDHLSKAIRAGRVKELTSEQQVVAQLDELE